MWLFCVKFQCFLHAGINVMIDVLIGNLLMLSKHKFFKRTGTESAKRLKHIQKQIEIDLVGHFLHSSYESTWIEAVRESKGLFGRGLH